MGYFDDKDNQEKINAAVKKSASVYEAGVYEVEFKEVKKVVSKKGQLFLKLTFGDKNHKPFEKMFGWADSKYKEKELQKLGEWAQHISKGHPLNPGQSITDEEEVGLCEKWFSQYIGNKVKVALRLEEQLFAKEEDGEFTLIKFSKNTIFLLTSCERSLIVTDMSKLKVGLNDEDKAKWAAYQAKQAKAKQEAADAKENDIPNDPDGDIPAHTGSDDDTPF